MLNNALTYARDHRADALESLVQLLRIPSVSTLPQHKADLRQAAEWLAGKLFGIGMERVEVIPTTGHPIVYAEWLDAGPAAPTLLIYGHYDVQPADPLDAWRTPPFEPTIQGDKLIGRGTSDDKGQFYTHIAAVEAYLKTAGRLPLNIKFMLEGEEELGSPHLGVFVTEHIDLLKTDVAAISDTHIIDPQTPALITGVRGMTYMEVSMRGSDRDLHSGIYGGVIENPLNVMARVIGSLRDEHGRITIAGFYDRVLPLSQAERRAINSDRMNEQRILAETGAPAIFGDPDYTIAERIGARPSLDVHGIKGGFTGAGQKTVIPATASAKVSMRLVPDQDPDEIAELFTRHIQAITPPTVQVTVKKLSAAPGALIDMTAPAIKAAALAYERGFGRRPYFLREGGSIPVVAMLTNVLQAPVAMMGFGLPDDGLHSPNEQFHLPNFYRGIETAIHYYDILGQGPQAG